MSSQVGTNSGSMAAPSQSSSFVPKTDAGSGLLQFSDPVISKLCTMLMSSAPKVSKTWHNIAHAESRKLMQLCISKLILRKKPPSMGSYPEDTLFQVAEMIENRLYESAPNYDEYYNPSTLISRIKFLVINLLDEAKTEPPAAVKEEDVDEEVPEPVIESEMPASVDATEMSLIPEDAKKFLTSDFMTAKAVSSQGCSRVFILKVLNKVNEYIQSNQVTSIFAVRRELVQKWLDEVKKECCNPNQEKEEIYYGGAPFVMEDSSTHWCESNQLFTWWKNNIERKTKFKVLQEDANYGGIDVRKCQRARWCEAVVSLVAAIRATLALTTPSRVVEKPPTSQPNPAPVVAAPALAAAPSSSFPNPPTNSYSQPQDQQRLPSMLGSTGQNMLLSQNNPTAASFPFMGMVGMMNSTNLMPALNPNPAVPNVDTSSHANKSFLIQLHDLLTKEHQDIIVWEADGLKFSIKDIMRFRSVVLPKCFPNMEYATFLKNLAGYGFEVIDGEHGVLYHHPLFIRERRELAANICELIPTTTPLLGSNIWPSQPVLPSLLGGATTSNLGHNYLNLGSQSQNSTIPGMNTNSMHNPFGNLAGMGNTTSLLGGLSNSFPYSMGGMGNFDWNALSQFGMGNSNPMLQNALSQMIQNNFAMSYPFPVQYGGLGGFYPNMYGGLDNTNNLFNYGVQGMNNPPANIPTPLPLSSTLSNIVHPTDTNNYDLKRKRELEREAYKAKETKPDESHDELVSISEEENGRAKRRAKKTVKGQELSSEAKSHIAKAFSHNLIQAALGKVRNNDSESEDGSLQSTDLEDEEEDNAPKGRKRGRKPGPKKGRAKKDDADNFAPPPQMKGDVDEDVIDLRNPKNKRILMDFTATQDDVKDDGEPKSVVSYVYGVFHGKVVPSKSSNATCLRRSREHNANQPRIDPSINQGLRVGRATIDPNQSLDFKCSRVGENFQADVPKMRTKSSLNAEKVDVSEAMYVPTFVSEDDIEDIVVAYNNKHGYLPSVGDVVMVHISDPESKRKFKLCAVLEVIRSKNDASADFDLDTCKVRVSDGETDFETPATNLHGPNSVNEDKVLDLLHRNEYSVKKALHEANKASGDNRATSLSETWSSGEVRRFCNAFRRHGENLRRIYQQSFFETKEYAEIVEFFHHIQPYLGGSDSDKVVEVFVRAEWAKKGFPEGEPPAAEENTKPSATTSEKSKGFKVESIGSDSVDNLDEDKVDEADLETVDKQNLSDQDTAESSPKNVKKAIVSNNTSSRRSSRSAGAEAAKKGSGRESDVAEQSESSKRSSRSSDKEAKLLKVLDSKKPSSKVQVKEPPSKIESSVEEESDEEESPMEKLSVRTRAKKKDEVPIIATEGHFGYLSFVEFDKDALDKLNTRRKASSEPEPRKLRRNGDGILSKSDLRLCFCRKELDYGEKYIACCLGKKEVCNGWVHLWCVGLGRAPNDKLKKMKNYVCKECEDDSSEDSSEENA